MTNPLNPFASELSFNFSVTLDGNCGVKQAVLNGIDQEMRERALCTLVRCAIAVGIMACAITYPIGWWLGFGLYTAICLMASYDIASIRECHMGRRIRAKIEQQDTIDVDDLADNLNSVLGSERYTDAQWSDWANPAIVLYVLAGAIVCAVTQ